MAEMVGMVGITSRSLIHNLNELQRLEKHYFSRLGRTEAKTIQVCGHEFHALALHYKKYVASWRLGIDTMTCEEIERYFEDVATVMEDLLDRIRHPPVAIHQIYDTYEHGHATWTLDGSRRSSDVNNVIMQLWQDGHAGSWFLAKETGPSSTEDGASPESRLDELNHLAKLLRRLSKTYQGLKDQPGSHHGHRSMPYDEKDALVFNLAELLKRKARPVSHVIDIATLVHAWATGDPNPQQARFQAAFKKWKNRP